MTRQEAAKFVNILYDWLWAHLPAERDPIAEEEKWKTTEALTAELERIPVDKQEFLTNLASIFG